MAVRRLPRLPLGVPLIDVKTGCATTTFQTWWQQFASAAEGNDIGLQTAIDLINSVQTQVDDLAAGVGAITDQSSLQNSYVDGCTIAADGPTADIYISDHTRVYGNGDTVAVLGSVVPSSFNTSYFIYYDDPARAGGAVTYALATNSADVSQTIANRHYVGSVTTPFDSFSPGTTGTPNEAV